MGGRVVTKKGRKFYNEAPTTEWIIHLPIANRSGRRPSTRVGTT